MYGVVITLFFCIFSTTVSERRLYGEISVIPKDEFTYIALVGVRTAHQYWYICVGAIIHEMWVLTAAHCFQLSLYRIKTNFIRRVATLVKVGSTNLVAGKWIEAKVVRLPKYRGELLPKDDILLLKCDEKISFGPTVSKLNLPPEGYTLTPGTIGKIAGWGETRPRGGHASQSLHYTSLKIISDEECALAMEDINWEEYGHSRFCAVGIKTGSCDGDMGSPFVIDNYVVGVLSHSSANCDASTPEVFTRVDSYREWITDKFNMLKEDTDFLDEMKK